MRAVPHRQGQQPPAELVAAVAALERTALSWERTAMSIAALGAASFKLAGTGTLVQAGGALMMAAAVLLVVVVVPLGYVRARSQLLRDGPRERLEGDDPLVRLGLLGTAGLVSVVAVLAGVEALLLL